jgi:hypothetical protein
MPLACGHGSAAGDIATARPHRRREPCRAHVAAFRSPPERQQDGDGAPFSIPLIREWLKEDQSGPDLFR